MFSQDLKIRCAQINDVDYIAAHDHHVALEELTHKIARGEVLIASSGDLPVGFLRWNLFWDNTPFINLLWVDELARKNGLGTQLVKEWESTMKQRGFHRVLTSSQSNEDAQHFFRKLGYNDCGSLSLPGEDVEIVFLKELP